MNAILDPTPLQERLNQAVADMQALNALSIESGEPFTDEQQTQYDALSNTAEGLEKQIATLQRANERVKGLTNSGGAVQPAGDRAGNSPGVVTNPNPRVATIQTPDVPGDPGRQPAVNAKPGFEDDPKCGFRDMHEYLENVMRYGETVTGRRSGFRDDRINFLSSQNVAERTGFLNDCSTGDCADGGSTSDLTGSVFVPVEFAPDMFKVGVDIPSGAFRTTRRTTRGMSIQRRYRLDKDHRESVTGGFQVGRNYEHCCNVSSAAEYSMYTVTCHPLYGAYCASDMLLETNPQMIIQEVEDGFRTEFESNRIIEILNGQGQGEYRGIWNSNAIITLTPESGGDVSKLDIYKMGERCWRGGGGARNLVWIAGLNHESKLKTLQDSTTSMKNHFLFDPNAGPEWADGMLDGKPIVFTEYVPGIGFLGGFGLYNFGEFEEFTWRPLRMATSLHARFICNETVMKFWTYTGGQPRWDSTLIPKAIPDGEDVNDHTLAPFVLLGGTAAGVPKPSRIHKKKPA